MPKIDSSVIIKNQGPNFERDQFNTKADMLAYPHDYLNDGHISYCIEEQMHYKWNARTESWVLFTAEMSWVDDDD